ncbi:hypothetical protein ACN38_g6430 [Penicillium nordicum]|uniref:Uncharacterized protein n=1 Tax=Penicillium nordicum TaxID=229535 RepID=A0A0M9WFA3_9EURO|nr:hypothetical protein ACN38_g6430 [Penicillium nordicum]
MANNITNIISIVVNVAPAPSPPTSAPQPSSSRSAPGTSQSTGEQLVESPGFWALLCIAAGLIAGASYLVWGLPSSKQGDPENTRIAKNHKRNISAIASKGNLPRLIEARVQINHYRWFAALLPDFRTAEN